MEQSFIATRRLWLIALGVFFVTLSACTKEPLKYASPQPVEDWPTLLGEVRQQYAEKLWEVLDREEQQSWTIFLEAAEPNDEETKQNLENIKQTFSKTYWGYTWHAAGQDTLEKFDEENQAALEQAFEKARRQLHESLENMTQQLKAILEPAIQKLSMEEDKERLRQIISLIGEALREKLIDGVLRDKKAALLEDVFKEALKKHQSKQAREK